MGFDFKAGPKVGSGLGFTGGPKLGRKAPDPLADVEYTGDLAEDATRELSAMEDAYRDRAKAEADRFRDATDSEYWVAVCFKTREDKERFLAAAGLLPLGDKYLDGHALARKLGIDMEEGS